MSCSLSLPGDTEEATCETDLTDVKKWAKTHICLSGSLSPLYLSHATSQLSNVQTEHCIKCHVSCLSRMCVELSLETQCNISTNNVDNMDLATEEILPVAITISTSLWSWSLRRRFWKCTACCWQSHLSWTPSRSCLQKVCLLLIKPLIISFIFRQETDESRTRRRLWQEIWTTGSGNRGDWQSKHGRSSASGITLAVQCSRLVLFKPYGRDTLHIWCHQLTLFSPAKWPPTKQSKRGETGKAQW